MERKMEKIKKNWQPNWSEVFMQVAWVMSQKSHCIWVNAGAVLAVKKDDKWMFINTGHNGAVRGSAHCDEEACTNRDDNGNKLKDGYCRGAHAEMNAITNAADLGIDISNAILFVILSPCLECAKHIANSKIKEVVYLYKYSHFFPDKGEETGRAIELLTQNGKICKKFEGNLIIQEGDKYVVKIFSHH